jgi:hypothetical protein
VSKEIDMSTEKPNPLVQLVDPSGNVVTVKRHSLPTKNGAIRPKDGWSLFDPSKPPAKKPAK